MCGAWYRHLLTSDLSAQKGTGERRKAVELYVEDDDGFGLTQGKS